MIEIKIFLFMVYFLYRLETNCGRAPLTPILSIPRNRTGLADILRSGLYCRNAFRVESLIDDRTWAATRIALSTHTQHVPWMIEGERAIKISYRMLRQIDLKKTDGNRLAARAFISSVTRDPTAFGLANFGSGRSIASHARFLKLTHAARAARRRRTGNAPGTGTTDPWRSDDLD
jgi:hypothetical protein